MKWKYLTALIFVNIVYLVIGGCIFHLIEFPEEQQNNKLNTLNLLTLKKEILDNVTCLTPRELDDVITRVITAYDAGSISIDENDAWSITGSIFFASTVITTIGYGYISPDTVGGRIFCCFFALLGIPLCLTMLGGIGKKLNNLGKLLDQKLNKGWFSPNVGRSLRALILFVIGIGLFVLIPAVILVAVEPGDEWTYGASVYYCIITLTTVGFGDMVAGQSEDKEYRWVYSISLTCWIMIGLAWAAAMIANLQEIYQEMMYPDTSEDEEQNNSVSTKEDIPLVTSAAPMSYTEEKPPAQ